MQQFDMRMTIEPNMRIISEMIRLFNKFDSDVYIGKNNSGRYINAKSLLGVLSDYPHLMDILNINVYGNCEVNDCMDIERELKFILLKH